MQSSAEKKIYAQFVAVKDPMLKPLLRFLDKCGIKPDVLSYLGITLMIIFFFIAGTNPTLAFWLLVIRMLLDGIDGPLARYQQTASDRGKFTDALADQLGFALFIFGLVKAGLAGGLPAIVFVYFTLLVTVLMIVKKNMHQQSDWLIKPWAGAFPHTLIYISYALYGIYSFTSRNYFREAFILFSALMIFKAAVDYLAIRNAKFS